MNDVRFLSLAKYTSPEIVEKKNQEFVEYGEDNDYYQHLIDRYNGSPTNNAIINAISEMIYGEGLNATNADKKPDEYAQMVAMFSKDCVRKLCYDLKLMGSCAIQIIYSKDRTRVAQVEHYPIETIRAEKCNKDGEVEGYYYHPNWKDYKKGDELLRIPAFGTSQENIELYCVKPYRAGYYYYSPVDYQGGLQYAELEEEISNFHLNNIMNGMAPSMLINMNNGQPAEEERHLIERRITEKWTGSTNSGRFVLSFNDSTDNQTTIEPIQLSDAHNQYEFLSNESMRKIMVAHRVVSPMLLGIKDNTGLGNNADELKTASTLMDNTVIRPFQRLLIDAFDQILAYNNISLNLYFKTLQPLEFTDLTNAQTEEQVEEETGQKLSDERPFLSDEEADQIWNMISELGEDELEGYELIDVEDVGEEPMEFDAESYLKQVVLSKNDDSDQDTDIWKVRYKYVKGTRKQAEGESREFCRRMLSADKLYRKEDIIKMGNQGVNKELGHKGQKYSLWLHKGGVYCHHRWERRVYKKKLKKNGEPYGGGALTGTNYKNVNQAIREGFKPEKNPKAVAQAPVDRADKGHHPNYKR